MMRRRRNGGLERLRNTFIVSDEVDGKYKLKR